MNDDYIKDLIERDTAKSVKWEKADYIGRICPTCGHVSYYCYTQGETGPKQPDNFCSKCGQRFIIE